ncbi:MAG: hypothetical protein P0Y53_09150 [Candidatus Pseudobacter hemicellulosilyticus]|uniref:Uncharacterized protein n=1 Tax=Candidatus Pseudobacter hemicellulosilyticus TaxID=3121375 RepID=A0AAJ6BHW6_9BACT|nr:MAG: hypothetical protein P0Y53_09150 [Pseudobacter sp.]
MASRSDKGDMLLKSNWFKVIGDRLTPVSKAAVALSEKANGTNTIYGLMGFHIFLAGPFICIFNPIYGYGMFVVGVLLMGITLWQSNIKPKSIPPGPPNQKGHGVGKRQSIDKQDTVIKEAEVENPENAKAMSNLMKVYEGKGLIIENNYNSQKQELIKAIKIVFADTNVYQIRIDELNAISEKIILEIETDISKGNINERYQSAFVKLCQDLIVCLEILHSNNRRNIEFDNKLKTNRNLIQTSDNYTVQDVFKRNEVTSGRCLIDIIDEFERLQKNYCDLTIKQKRDLKKAELVFGYRFSNTGGFEIVSDQHEKYGVFDSLVLLGLSVNDYNLSDGCYSNNLKVDSKWDKNYPFDTGNISSENYRLKQETQVFKKPERNSLMNLFASSVRSNIEYLEERNMFCLN